MFLERLCTKRSLVLWCFRVRCQWLFLLNILLKNSCYRVFVRLISLFFLLWKLLLCGPWKRILGIVFNESRIFRLCWSSSSIVLEN